MLHPDRKPKRQGQEQRIWKTTLQLQPETTKQNREWKLQSMFYKDI